MSNPFKIAFQITGLSESRISMGLAVDVLCHEFCIFLVTSPCLRTQEADSVIHQAHIGFTVAGDHNVSVGDKNRHCIFQEKRELRLKDRTRCDTILIR